MEGVNFIFMIFREGSQKIINHLVSTFSYLTRKKVVKKRIVRRVVKSKAISEDAGGAEPKQRKRRRVRRQVTAQEISDEVVQAQDPSTNPSSDNHESEGSNNNPFYPQDDEQRLPQPAEESNQQGEENLQQRITAQAATTEAVEQQQQHQSEEIDDEDGNNEDEEANSKRRGRMRNRRSRVRKMAGAEVTESSAISTEQQPEVSEMSQQKQQQQFQGDLDQEYQGESQQEEQEQEQSDPIPTGLAELLYLQDVPLEPLFSSGFSITRFPVPSIPIYIVASAALDSPSSFQPESESPENQEKLKALQDQLAFLKSQIASLLVSQGEVTIPEEDIPANTPRSSSAGAPPPPPPPPPPPIFGLQQQNLAREKSVVPSSPAAISNPKIENAKNTPVMPQPSTPKVERTFSLADIESGNLKLKKTNRLTEDGSLVLTTTSSNSNVNSSLNNQMIKDKRCISAEDVIALALKRKFANTHSPMKVDHLDTSNDWSSPNDKNASHQSQSEEITHFNDSPFRPKQQIENKENRPEPINNNNSDEQVLHRSFHKTPIPTPTKEKREKSVEQDVENKTEGNPFLKQRKVFRENKSQSSLIKAGSE